MSNIQMVVFDMAGTTVQDHKEVETCFSKACELTGLKVSDARILALQGYAKKEVFQLLWDEKIGKDHPEYTENVFVSYDTFKEILEGHYLENPIFPTEHCLETFEWLRSQNIKIALTTGFYRKVANIILDKLGWLKNLNDQYYNESGMAIIDFSVTPSEVKVGRPQADMIQLAMSQFNITDPKQVINIGDTPVDLESGYNAGVYKSLAVTNGTHSKAQLVKYPNDGLLLNLSELPQIINKMAILA